MKLSPTPQGIRDIELEIRREVDEEMAEKLIARMMAVGTEPVEVDDENP